MWRLFQQHRPVRGARESSRAEEIEKRIAENPLSPFLSLSISPSLCLCPPHVHTHALSFTCLDTEMAPSMTRRSTFGFKRARYVRAGEYVTVSPSATARRGCRSASRTWHTVPNHHRPSPFTVSCRCGCLDVFTTSASRAERKRSCRPAVVAQSSSGSTLPPPVDVPTSASAAKAR